MTDKILDYKTVNCSEQAKRVVKDFENRYHCDYSWGKSNGNVVDAVAVCLLETADGYRFITTAAGMRYIENRKVIKTYTLGEL